MHYRIALALLVTASTGVAAQAPGGSPWSVTLGAGAAVAPKHAGSDEYRVLPLPFVQVTYRDRVFLGPASSGVGGGIGAYVLTTPRLRVSAELGMMENRPADRSDVLAGTDDRDALGTAGASMSYRMGPLEAGLGVIHGLNDGGGLQGTAQLGYTRFLQNFVMATVAANATAASARQLRREFGVTATEAQRRASLVGAGDERLRADEAREYRPGAGISQVGASMSVTCFFSPHWMVSAFGGASRLGDVAADSPLVREREQWSGGLAVIWRL